MRVRDYIGKALHRERAMERARESTLTGWCILGIIDSELLLRIMVMILPSGYILNRHHIMVEL